jgi:hypothetical protein
MKKHSVTLLFALFSTTAMHISCVIRFSNSERQLDASFRKIYVPSGTDVSTRGGQASRLSLSIRRALALDTRISLVDLEEARVGVNIVVNNRTLVPTKTEECKIDTTSGDSVKIASGAYSCAEVRSNFNLPAVSSEEESLYLDVDVEAIDLNDGKTLWRKRFEKISSGPFPVVGAGEVRDGLAFTPQLHALRYVENTDLATQAIGSSIAQGVLDGLLQLNTNATIPE